MLNYSQMTILITGAAGFIGSHLARRVLTTGAHVIGLDNISGDQQLTTLRLAAIDAVHGDWQLVRGDICDRILVDHVMREHAPAIVVHLAAKAGVRASLADPTAYVDTNIVGFHNILAACTKAHVKHLVYASSSAVYGDSTQVPFTEDAKADQPVSVYAATKRCDELLAHSYAAAFKLPVTGLRFFTVYGPMGRPDMACLKFANTWARGDTVELYDRGRGQRDFTFVDDLMDVICPAMCQPPTGVTPHVVYNVGRGMPVDVLTFADALHQELVAAGALSAGHDMAAHTRLVSRQIGDVQVTCADTTNLVHGLEYKPRTLLRDGLREFAKWYTEYKKSSSTVDEEKR